MTSGQESALVVMGTAAPILALAFFLGLGRLLETSNRFIEYNVLKTGEVSFKAPEGMRRSWFLHNALTFAGAAASLGALLFSISALVEDTKSLITFNLILIEVAVAALAITSLSEVGIRIRLAIKIDAFSTGRHASKRAENQ